MKSDHTRAIEFLLFHTIAVGVFAGFIYVLCTMLRPGLAVYISSAAIYGIETILYAMLAGMAVCSLGLWLLYVHPMPMNQGIRYSIQRYVRFFYPLASVIAAVIQQKRHIAYGYIFFLNHLTLHTIAPIDARHVLILTPHCLQWDQCPHKITRNVHNCHRCGHCHVGDILELADSLGMPFAVATGGTLARQLVQQYRPRLVIAVACERDLISGMEDTAPLPVVGLLNARPHGPCFNTTVDIEALRTLIYRITGERHECTRNSLSESADDLQR